MEKSGVEMNLADNISDTALLERKLCATGTDNLVPCPSLSTFSFEVTVKG